MLHTEYLLQELCTQCATEWQMSKIDLNAGVCVFQAECLLDVTFHSTWVFLLFIHHHHQNLWSM